MHEHVCKCVCVCVCMCVCVCACSKYVHTTRMYVSSLVCAFDVISMHVMPTFVGSSLSLEQERKYAQFGQLNLDKNW